MFEQAIISKWMPNQFEQLSCLRITHGLGCSVSAFVLLAALYKCFVTIFFQFYTFICFNIFTFHKINFILFDYFLIYSINIKQG